VGTDHLTAKEFAQRLGEKTNTIVAPTIPVGDSLSLMGFSGTLTVETDTFYRYVRDVCFSLVANGFERILFLSPHISNVNPVDRVGRELKFRGILSAQVDLWRFLYLFKDEPGLVETKEFAIDHGGEINTSVVMAMFPDLVDIKSAQEEIPKPSFVHKYQGSITTYRDFVDYSKTGTQGYPAKGSADKGNGFIEKVMKSLVQFMQEFKSEPLPACVDPLTKKLEEI
jgi:creatinine amidohydrolase